MKKKIQVLIFTSILGLIALSFIQAYLVNNTYKLKKDVFLEETKRSISRFDNDIDPIDSIYDRLTDHLLYKLSDYKLNRIKKERLFDDLEIIKDSFNTDFMAICQAEFEKRNLEYPIRYQKRLQSIILLDSIKNDTVYFESDDVKRKHLLGDEFEPIIECAINNSQVRTVYEHDYIEDGVKKNVSFHLSLVTVDYIDINGWVRIVLKQMTSILVLSVLIFAVVLGLLYYAIKSLITQKKIADVKTDFINNITHELKTPLATLSLATKMLKNDTVKTQPEIVETTVNTIDRQSHRLQKLIDQVLDNSLGYQDINLQKETVDIKSFLDTILDDFLLSVNDKLVTLNRAITEHHEQTSFDIFYMTTAILNILENAVKYNQEGVTITITSKIDKELIIKVKDDGIGISEINQKQIFDKFYRVGNNEIHNVKGLGLGLYYANQIIKAHHGRIVINSKESQGAEFTITLPLK